MHHGASDWARRCGRAPQRRTAARAQVLDVDKTLPNGHVSGDDLVRPPLRTLRRFRPNSLTRCAGAQGCMDCRLSEIVGARGSTVLRPLVSKRSKQARPLRRPYAVLRPAT